MRKTFLLFAWIASCAVLSAQSTWTGTTSSQWNDASNWSPAAIPTASDDVVLTTAGFPPSTANFDVACASLTIDAGVSLTITTGEEVVVNGDLSVDGSTIGNGRLLLASPSGTATFGPAASVRDVWIAEGAVIAATGLPPIDGDLWVRGDLSVSATDAVIVLERLRVGDGNPPAVGSLTIDATSLEVVTELRTFPGSVLSAPTVQTVSVGSAIISAVQFAADGPIDLSGATSVTLGGRVEVDDVVDFSSATVVAESSVIEGATGALAFGSGEHVFRNTLILAGDTSWHPAATVRVEPTIAAQILSVDDPRNSSTGLPPLTVAGPQEAQIGGGLSQPMRIRGDLTVIGGSFRTRDSTVEVEGDLVVSNAEWSTVPTADGVFDVAGDASFADVEVSNMGNLRLAGALVGDATFVPGNGRVTFAGPGLQAVSLASGAFAFHEVAVEAGTTIETDLGVALSSLDDSALTVAGTLAAGSSEPFVVSGGVHVVAGGQATSATSALLIDGRLLVDPETETEDDVVLPPGRLQAVSATSVAFAAGEPYGDVDFGAATVSAGSITRLNAGGVPPLDALGVLSLGPGEHVVMGEVRLRGVVDWHPEATLRHAPPLGFESRLESHDDPDDPTVGLPPTTFAGPGQGRLAGVPNQGASAFMRIRGDLVVEGGEILAESSTRIDGDFELHGAWAGGAGWDGRLTVAGTTSIPDPALLTAESPRLTCLGDLVVPGGFEIPNLRLEFAGDGVQVVQAMGQSIVVDDVDVRSGAEVVVDAETVSVIDTLDVYGTLDCGDALLDVSSGTPAGSGTIGGLLWVRPAGVSPITPPGRLVLGSGEHVVFGDLVNQGVIDMSEGGRFRVAPKQDNTVLVGGDSAFPDIVLAGADEGGGVVSVGSLTGGPGVVGSTTFARDLEIASGTVWIAGSVDVATVTVQGDARLLGGTWGMGGSRPLVVEGLTTIDGTDVSDISELRCRGDLEVLSGSTIGGDVVFASPDPQTITGIGPIFNRVEVAPGGLLNLTQPLTTSGALTVEGLLVDDGHAIDVGGDLAVAPTGVLSIGDAPLTARARMFLDGKVHSSGSVDWTVGSNATWRGGPAAILGDLRIDVAGTATVTGSQPTATGLTLANGDVNLSQGSRLLVLGDATFEGGSLVSNLAAEVDVRGDARFVGTDVSSFVTLSCGGDWLADAAFAPTLGEVRLGDAGTTRLESVAPDDVLRFHDLVFTGADCRPIEDLAIDADSVRVAPGARVAVDGVALDIGDVPWDVDGTLALGAGGRVDLGAAADVDVGGTLEAVGSLVQPAVVAGTPGGASSLVVSGALAARRAVFQDLGPTGLDVGGAAAIGPAPNDLRGVLFTNPHPSPGSSLLTLVREAPTSLPGVSFEDPLGQGTFNASVPGGAPVTFVGWDGAFGGAAFEDDPNDLVSWVDELDTVLASFDVTPGAERVDVAWSTESEDVVDAFLVETRVAGAPGFTLLAELLPSLDATYAVAHEPLVPGQTYDYRLSQRLVDGVVDVLAEASATPYSADPPSNLLEVGPGAAFADIAAALTAVSLEGSTVAVATGVYPPFEVDGTQPAGLRIVADGSGPVVITTVNGPVVVRDVPAAGSVELTDLVIGSTLVDGDALQITNCDGPVVLTDTTVGAGDGFVALDVAASTAVALQRSSVDGTRALVADSGSRVIASRGVLESLELTASSTLRTVDVAIGPSTVDGTSSLTELPGAMPDVAIEPLLTLGEPTTLALDVDADTPWTLLVSTGLAWNELSSATWELVLLVDVPSSVPLLSLTGPAELEFVVPPDGALAGLPIALQLATFPAGQPGRFSNVATTMPVP